MYDPGSQELTHSKTLAVGCMRRDRMGQLAFRATSMLHPSEFLFGSGAVVGARSSGNRLGIRLGRLESPDISVEGRFGLAVKLAAKTGDYEDTCHFLCLTDRRRMKNV